MQIENYLLVVSFSKYSNRTKQVQIGDWLGHSIKVHHFIIIAKTIKLKMTIYSLSSLLPAIKQLSFSETIFECTYIH